MLPFAVLVTTTALVRLTGAMGVEALDSWPAALRVGFATMLLLTASAHFSSRREWLVRMVPARLPRPDLLVSATGVLELVGAVGLLIPATTVPAAVMLIGMMIAMFPANVRAARAGIATPLLPRTLMQIAFVAALTGAMG